MRRSSELNFFSLPLLGCSFEKRSSFLAALASSKLRYLPIAISCLLLVLTLSGMAQEPSKPQTTDKTAQTQPDQTQPKPALPSAVVKTPVQMPAAERQQVRNEPTKYEEKDLGFQSRMADASELQAYLIGAEALLLALTAWFAYIAVTQTRNAAKSAREFLRSQNMGECAWLATQGFKVSNVVPGTNPVDFAGFEFRYKVANCGKTPANNIRMVGEVRVVEPDTNVATLEFGASVNEQHTNSLGPTTQFLGPVRRVASADVYDSAYGKKLIVAWVRIEYEDIFGVAHETETTGLLAYTGKVAHLGNANVDPAEFTFTISYVGPRNFIR